MIIHTNKAFFKPAFILTSILFLPAIIALIVCSVFFKEIPIFIIIGCCLIVYVLVSWLLSRESRSDKNYLKTVSNGIEIKYPNISKNEEAIFFGYEKIEKIDYYRINSFVSWFALVQMQLPKAFFVSYKDNDRVIRKAAGHAELKEIAKLCEENDIKLVVH